MRGLFGQENQKKAYGSPNGRVIRTGESEK